MGFGESAGGLVGYAHQANFSHVFSTGTVDAGTGRYVGGLIGRAEDNSNVSTSYSTAAVSGGLTVGGLVGSFEGRKITGSFRSGSDDGEEETGGLAGSFASSVTVENSWSTASVSGGRFTGGLVGANDGRISNSFSACQVSGTPATGRLVGRNAAGNAGARHSFWDLDTSGQAGIGQATAEMRSRATYGNEWDFDNIWVISEGESYPYLIENPEP